MKNLKYLFLILMFISSTAYGQIGGGGIYGGGSGGVSVASDCDVAAYRGIGKLCQDSDDGKLYKGTGSSVLEVAAGASTGDVTGPSASTDFEVAVYSSTGGKTLKRSNNFTGLAKLTEGVLSTVSLGTLTNTYICTYSTVNGIQCNTNPTTYGMVYPGAGIAVSTGSAWTTAATYETITGLWTSCTSGYLKYDGTCATPTGGAGTGDVATDAIWDAKGDLAVGTAANTAAKLAVGTAYQVLHVATDTPAWTSTLGATGTRLTKIWATDLEVTNAPTVNGAALTTILQPLDGELTALAGLTSAANAIPYFTGSGTAGVISSSANMVSLLGSDDYATARVNLGLEIGANVQAYSDILAGIAGVTPANNGIFGYNNAGTLGLYTNHSHDDSAAQFYDTTDATKTMQLELGSITTGTNRTLTVPDASGTIALVKTEKLAVFNIPGTSDDGTVVDAYIPVASTITGVIVTTSGAACSAVVDIWSQAYADFPPENAQTITASAPPTLTTAQMSKDTTLTGWTKPIAADTILRANLDSSDCAGNIQVTLIGTK